MDQQKIGLFIAKLRKEKGMTQQELANKIGVTDKAISKWENGRCLMDIAMLKPLSKSLGISEMELINGEQFENNENNDKSSEFVEVTIKLANKKIKDSVKKIILGIIAVLLLIGLIIGIIYIKKFAYDYVYNYDSCWNIEEGYNLNNLTFEKETIVNTTKLNEFEYLILEHLKVPSMFGILDNADRLKIKQELFENELKYNGYGFESSEDSEISGHISIYTRISLSYIFLYNSSGSTIIGDTFEYRKKFLEKNKIENEHELIKYIAQNLNIHDNNWLTNSLKEMKDDFIMMNIAYDLFDYNAISSEIITGAYDGYIITDIDDYKIINIYDGIFVYEIELSGKYAKDEFVQEFLNTIVIENPNDK